MSEPIKLNLWQKIHAVMRDVEYLKKDDTVKYEGKTGVVTNYKAISEEKVTSVVRACLVKYGLVIIPVEQDHKKDGNLSTVDTKYKIIDIDTGEFEIAVSSGTGADTQDKGVGKSMAYSYKYLLLRTFAIPTGDDPDKISSDELTDKFKGNDSTPKPKPATGQPAASADIGAKGDKPAEPQKPDTSEADKLTDKQLKFINTLCGRKMINELQGVVLIEERYKKSNLYDLTKKEAIDFIDYLQAS